MKVFEERTLVQDAKAFVFIDGKTLIVPQERAPDMRAVTPVKQFLEDKLAALRKRFNKTKPQALLPEGTESSDHTADQQEFLTAIGVHVLRGGITLVGIRVSSVEY